MRTHNENNGLDEHKHEGLLMFLCFFGSAMAGYFLMNHFALFGV